MSESIHVGDFTITALEDGTGHLPPMFYPGADFTAHADLLHEDGTYHIRFGAYLVQGNGLTLLVDAGSGTDDTPFSPEIAAVAGLANPPEFLATTGNLPRSLAAAGVSPDDVTTIVLTHLHIDHIGWIAPHGKLYFPAAVVHYGAADWEPLIGSVDDDDAARKVMQAAASAGVLRPMDDASVEIAPGVTAHHAPGHTPGSYIVAIASDGEQLYLTGDVIEHPLQLTESGIDFLMDGDCEQAAKTRAGLFTEVAGKSIVIGTAHVPDPIFRKVTARHEWASTSAVAS